ncbi:hypothetical protein K461DRAFT_293930 [Myriangium duriaei CBS 260.36]|uniref:Uncharacterized protein n=1 Tax=Myriangium duriaei CBS 260.36 TaxID=1168546 RepID=A0A9P4MM06_9PEZI|nr:hypothetical protein K461DRAFT_293930 [Myriangium duriaei CBS 260.36]
MAGDTELWVEAESSADQLQEYLESLYWQGLIREIETTILALKQLEETASIPEEDDIMKRLPAEAAYFVGPWAPLKLNSNEWKDTWNSVATRMAVNANIVPEHQNYDVQYRRARMLLTGLSLLDISRTIDFRDPPLKSLAGKVQVNINTIPREGNTTQLLIQAVYCCDCKKAIRSSFYGCSESCVHHDDTEKTRCSFAKHVYNICLNCYLTTNHVKQHLRRIRPYDPMAVTDTAGMDKRSRSKLARDIQSLQKQIDEEEDFQDGNKLLRAVFRAVPEWASRIALPFGNVHVRIMFGPLTFEIGAGNCKGGALATVRSPPDLSYSGLWRFVNDRRLCPAVAVSPDRKVFRCNRVVSQQNIHATTMHVLGGLFSGHNPAWSEREDEVIKLLVAESSKYEEKPTKSRAYNERRLQEASARIVAFLKSFLKEEVSSYLQHLTSFLFAPSTNLRWDQISNNCQTFCQKLITHRKTFDTIFPKTKLEEIVEGSQPRFLLSFASEKFGALYDSTVYHTTPTAAYLAEFHTGEDIVEYFQTWPNIPKPNDCAALLC